MPPGNGGSSPGSQPKQGLRAEFCQGPARAPHSMASPPPGLFSTMRTGIVLRFSTGTGAEATNRASLLISPSLSSHHIPGVLTAPPSSYSVCSPSPPPSASSHQDHRTDCNSLLSGLSTSPYSHSRPERLERKCHVCHHCLVTHPP